MNRIILMIGLCWVSKISAQFTNGEFEIWDTISMFGQPYIDPASWITNNDNDLSGIANTPVTRGGDSTSFFARIESNDHGIDALLPGKLMQKIPTKNLVQITYAYQCAYIFQTGRCIVNIIGENSDTLLYTTSYIVQDADFQTAAIDILTAWTQSHDSIMIQFIAKGNLDMWDEEEDGHSVFLIDNVAASYVSATTHFKINKEILVYPNPTSGKIYISINNDNQPHQVEIYSINGNLIHSTEIQGFVEIQNLPNGIYIIKVISGKESHFEPVFVYR